MSKLKIIDIRMLEGVKADLSSDYYKNEYEEVVRALPGFVCEYIEEDRVLFPLLEKVSKKFTNIRPHFSSDGNFVKCTNRETGKPARVNMDKLPVAGKTPHKAVIGKFVTYLEDVIINEEAESLCNIHVITRLKDVKDIYKKVALSKRREFKKEILSIFIEGKHFIEIIVNTI